MEKKNSIVKRFKVLGRECIIIRNDYLTRFPKGFHNGYVEVKKHNSYDDYPYKFHEEQTYSGTWEKLDYSLKDIRFLGFDTIHIHDNELSQSLLVVEKRLRWWADEVLRYDMGYLRYKYNKLKDKIKNIFKKDDK